MSIALIGQKCGMTRIFTEEGVSIPVSVIKIDHHRITQIKSIENDGYSAIQITYGAKKNKSLTKPQIGHFKKAGVEAGLGLYEVRVKQEALKEFTLGQDLGVDQLDNATKVDVSGISKGKGFAGGVKRYHFKMQDATHGNSLSHRAPGSIGQCQTPGRVFKGKKMAGHMGNVQRTIQNLELIKIDKENGVILIKGSIPGSTGGYVKIDQSIKVKVKN